MVDERKEPVISGMRPEDDDVDVRATHSANRSSSRRPAPVSSRPVIVKSKIAPIALMFSFVGIGFATFLYWQMTQTELKLQDALSTSNARIAQLEGQLELTGDESTASVTAIQVKLKWVDSEIRKLWGVSYDTNRKAIADNKSTVDRLATTIKNINTQFAQYKKSTALEIKLMSELVDSQTATVSKIEANSADKTAAINALREQNRKLDTKLKSMQESIDAIDAFRRSVNADLLKLKQATSTP